VPRCEGATEGGVSLRICLLIANHVSPPTFVNFAYGSNMSTRRIRERAPSARPIGVGRLAGHRLAWHKAGRDGSAKCDITPSDRPDDAVWGVLYEIASNERHGLDQAEGLGRGYEHRTVTILTDSRSVAADVYCATQIDRSLRPFDWYLGLVLDGAIEHGLPARYVAGIEAVTADIDPNADRRQANFAILRSRLPLVRVAGLG
jgi:gamma-glutamylcyclotransferase